MSLPADRIKEGSALFYVARIGAVVWLSLAFFSSASNARSSLEETPLALVSNACMKLLDKNVDNTTYNIVDLYHMAWMMNEETFNETKQNNGASFGFEFSRLTSSIGLSGDYSYDDFRTALSRRMAEQHVDASNSTAISVVRSFVPEANVLAFEKCMTAAISADVQRKAMEKKWGVFCSVESVDRRSMQIRIGYYPSAMSLVSVPPADITYAAYSNGGNRQNVKIGVLMTTPNNRIAVNGSTPAVSIPRNPRHDIIVTGSVNGIGFDLNCSYPAEVARAKASASSCSDLLNKGSRQSGKYVLNATGTEASRFEVFCDMTTDGGGWTVVFSPDNTVGQCPAANDIATFAAGMATPRCDTKEWSFASIAGTPQSFGGKVLGWLEPGGNNGGAAIRLNPAWTGVPFNQVRYHLTGSCGIQNDFVYLYPKRETYDADGNPKPIISVNKPPKSAELETVTLPGPAVAQGLGYLTLWSGDISTYISQHGNGNCDLRLRYLAVR